MFPLLRFQLQLRQIDRGYWVQVLHQVYDIEMLVSQYADDTTPFLDEDLNSLNYAVQILKCFEKVSGLAINNDKTKVVNIEASKGRSILWHNKHGFECLD